MDSVTQTVPSVCDHKAMTDVPKRIYFFYVVCVSPPDTFHGVDKWLSAFCCKFSFEGTVEIGQW